MNKSAVFGVIAVVLAAGAGGSGAVLVSAGPGIAVVRAAPAPVGFCPFGHVDPSDDNSACRGSDSAQWPITEARPDGTPALSCSRLNDGQGVRTDTNSPYGFRWWKCLSYRDIGGNTYWEWTEVRGQ